MSVRTYQGLKDDVDRMERELIGAGYRRENGAVPLTAGTYARTTYSGTERTPIGPDGGTLSWIEKPLGR